MSAMSERLRKAREAAGYENAVDAARAFNWVKSTYHGHENGDRPISKAAAERYAAAFKIDPLLLLYEKPQKAVAKAAAQGGSLDVERLIFIVGYLLHWRGMPEIEADNLARAVIEYVCKPQDHDGSPVDRKEARTEARTLMRLFSTVRH